MQLHPVGAEFHAEGRTDKQDEANSRLASLRMRLQKKKDTFITAFDLGHSLPYCGWCSLGRSKFS
jgi:hypothetical protein